ncbi:MAG: ATP-binding protein [Verrucomicrobia bacterium CG_4_10_14_3_um_filter_43_23]|nr:MAG: hypothetical protein AUJ82_06710 [Verrucomicrobia bacterium CG1_02_43_26]PIP59764.1 MAG: hypothetical protein COX01_01760 [Verrucomicrobia bacterium CG22_combo_CG10-13_8_21_14_all_43_17]PIX58753.1 MAG: ATP-binding protein [Verrucomicrobia bacterium CG_4_10_14_3_um_filter_43_23]PIY61106.1 MAG: ATP-binding protein [Verrucomicrobia bacterium CG_4_10_14_0_8_um_filter_43_34]PJA44276.1 MAG: ATP-binding protein [Verrucomicrobia bacterium CG_4_9_14_3_um_filter_43_20]
MKFTYPNSLKSLEKLASDLEVFQEKANIDSKAIFELNLCMDEIITNIILYGFEDKDLHTIDVILDWTDQEIIVVISDTGKPFDPLKDAPVPNIEAEIEDRPVGGLGVYFLKQYLDSVNYIREGNSNRLVLRKKR